MKSKAYLIDDPIDLFYLTGLHMSKGQLLVKKHSARLSVDSRYSEIAQKLIHVTVAPIKWKGEIVGIDENKMTHASFRALKKSGAKPRPMQNPCEALRAQKDQGEIKAVQKSAAVVLKAATYLKGLLKVGITEKEVARLFIQYAQTYAEGPSFAPIVAFGKNGSMPHYTPGDVKLKNHQMVLLDLGVMFDGYASDITRTFPFGEAPKKMADIHALVKKAKDLAISLVKPGVTFKELDQEVRKVFGPLEKYFVHNLGHGIGLEVHENPRAEPFKENMIITIEPGLYLSGIGGVRLEEMVLVTKEGGVVLT